MLMLTCVCPTCSNMTRDTLSILKSREVIAINQDPLGVAGDLVWKQGPQEVSLHLIGALCSFVCPFELCLSYFCESTLQLIYNGFTKLMRCISAALHVVLMSDSLA